MSTAKKRGRGRPPLAEGEARDIVFTLRLTEAERDELVAAAEREGKHVTQWVRDASLGMARARR